VLVNISAVRLPMEASMKRLLRSFAFCLLVMLGIALPAHAQFKAGIEGTITDAKGAVVPNAKVTATNDDTGVIRSAMSSGEGFYRIVGLPPGTYAVMVEATGFSKKESTGVLVEAETVRGLDLKVEVAGATATVTVSGTYAGLETESASTSTTLDTRAVDNLPEVGRDPYELLRLAAGVFGDGARDGSGNSVSLPNSTGPGGSNTSIFQVENQVPISANGQRLTSNNFQIDGVSVNSLTWGGAAVVTPNQQSVQEVTVVTNSYSAEDGRNSGAQVKVVSKTGTNTFHGGGFFKYQDPNWNAFNKYGGINDAPPSRVNNNFRQYGANFGGPLFKDKLFFFFSYEGLKSNNVDTSAPTFVETPDFRNLVIAQRAGSIAATVLSQPGVAPRIASVLSASCAVDAGISDPTLCQPAGTGLDIGSLTGATGVYVPVFTPGTAEPAGGGLDGIPDIELVQLALPSTTRGNQYNARLDWYHGKDQFAVSTYFTSQNSISADSAGRSRPNQDITFKPFTSAVMLTWIRPFSSTFFNEARFNFTRYDFNTLASNGNVNWGTPRFEIQGYVFDRIRFGPDWSETTPAAFAQNIYTYRDILNWTHGRHALKFGGDVAFEQDNNDLAGGARPLYVSDHLWNFANDAPIFEQINANPNNGGPGNAQRYFRSKTQGYFVQDDFKFRPNLTLTVGLRYEYFSPLHDHRNQLSNLFYQPGDLVNAVVAPVEQLSPPDRNNFAPRLGFAWAPGFMHNKTVLRGGFGTYFNRIDDALLANSRANPPNFGRFGLCCGTSPLDFGTPFAGGTILYELGANKSPSSYAPNPALAFGIDPATGGVCGDAGCTFDQGVEIYGAPQNLRTPYVYEYSFDLEQQLPWKLFSDIGYQGSVGHKGIRLVNQNFLEQGSPSFFAVYFPTSDVNSSFNSLNVTLRRPFANGFQFQFYYRYSRSIDQLSNEGPGAPTNQTDPAFPRSEFGPSDYDATHYYSAYVIWEPPIFRGQHDWKEKVIGGWQFTTLVSAHSGFPWTPVTGVLTSQQVANGSVISPARPAAIFEKPDYSYDTSAFTKQNGNFTGIVNSGNCDATNPPQGGTPFFDICTHGAPPGIGRNIFRGPRYFGMDFSAMKRFGLPVWALFHEGSNIELRGNFFNLFNKLNLEPFGFNTTSTLIESGHFGQATGALAGRVIEFQAKLSF
jgi:Carboxypeptidase regulatory-like domain/TonB dependent receptor